MGCRAGSRWNQLRPAALFGSDRDTVPQDSHIDAVADPVAIACRHPGMLAVDYRRFQQTHLDAGDVGREHEVGS